MTSEQPPINAPTAPKAMRDRQATNKKAQYRRKQTDPEKTTQVPQAPQALQPAQAPDDCADDNFLSRPGQSVSWVSDQAAAQKRFAGMKEKARHLGFHVSPFLPEDPIEHTKFLGYKQAKEIETLKKKINEKEEAATQQKISRALVRARKEAAANVTTAANDHALYQLMEMALPPAQLKPFGGGQKPSGELSPVLMMDTCFANRRTTTNDWPSIAQFRAHKLNNDASFLALTQSNNGGQQAAAYSSGRSLPAPAVTRAAPQVSRASYQPSAISSTPMANYNVLWSVQSVPGSVRRDGETEVQQIEHVDLVNDGLCTLAQLIQEIDAFPNRED